MDPAIEHNRRAWDALARAGHRHAQPVTEAELADPLAQLDGEGWLGGDVRGRRVLCLAAGGGYQSVLFAAAGATVTVVDLSGQMLELDRAAAQRHGLAVQIVQASLSQLAALDDASFDVVWQPVSTCYVANVMPGFREAARVLVAGGLYVSQHKQPVSLQLDAENSGEAYRLAEPYYRQGPLPPVEGRAHRESGTLEYLHRWGQLLGELCRSGFVIEDVAEPCHADPHAAYGSYAHRALYAAPYLRLKARRVAGDATASVAGEPEPRLWLPGTPST